MDPIKSTGRTLTEMQELEAMAAETPIVIGRTVPRRALTLGLNHSLAMGIVDGRSRALSHA